MEKTIIIIGAGIAGLAAGCYGQMNGFRTKIYELHELPGGLCTAWDRKDYTFDGCIHYLYGSAAGKPFNHVWEELGTIQDCQIINHEELIQVIAPDGKKLIAYCDPDRWEEHLLQLSAKDHKASRRLAQGVRNFLDFDMSLIVEKPRELMGLGDWMRLGLQMTPFLGTTARYGLLDARDMANQFTDPFIQRAFPHLFAWPKIPMIAALATLAYMHTGNAGFPVGGSLAFARRLEKRYLDLGGEIHYKSQVQKILVKNGKAVGVRLYSDEEIQAEAVISTADGRGTIYELLDGEFTNHKIDSLYAEGNLPVLSQLLVSFGVKRDLTKEPYWATYLLEQPLTIAGRAFSEISVKHYCFDPSLAPPGHSVIEIMLPTSYDYWKSIYGRKLYDTEQDQVAEQLLEFLESIYPGIHEDVEVVDVATPLSYERYTENWLGSTCGWLLTKKTMTMMITGMRKTLPRLQNFYLAGQWVEPGGGLALAAYSGRNAIRLICQADGIAFTTDARQIGAAT